MGKPVRVFDGRHVAFRTEKAGALMFYDKAGDLVRRLLAPAMSETTLHGPSLAGLTFEWEDQ